MGPKVLDKPPPTPPLKQNSTRPGMVKADQEFQEVILDYIEYQASLTYVESQ